MLTVWISYKGVGRIKGTLPKNGEAPRAGNSEEPAGASGGRVHQPLERAVSCRRGLSDGAEAVG